jgi:hypothetical protein
MYRFYGKETRLVSEDRRQKMGVGIEGIIIFLTVLLGYFSICKFKLVDQMI